MIMTVVRAVAAAEAANPKKWRKKLILWKCVAGKHRPILMG